MREKIFLWSGRASGRRVCSLNREKNAVNGKFRLIDPGLIEW